jgi:hypothetical protein
MGGGFSMPPVGVWGMLPCCIGMFPGGMEGIGGGCIVLGPWVGDACIPSSTGAMEDRISVMGESSAVLLIYFGVRASEEAGGDMYCSTPMSIGNVWLRGRWKLLLDGCPLIC